METTIYLKLEEKEQPTIKRKVQDFTGSLTDLKAFFKAYGNLDNKVREVEANNHRRVLKKMIARNVFITALLPPGKPKVLDKKKKVKKPITDNFGQTALTF